MKYSAPFGVADTNPDAGYVNGDPTIGRKGSIPPAAAFENPQRELVNLIDKAGQLPTDDDLYQVTRAIRDGRLNYCLDTGTANSIQISVDPMLAQYTAGLTLRVKAAHTVTGPATITIGNLNPTSIKRRDGSELQDNDIVDGQIATLVCDGTYFQLQNMGSGEGTGDTTVFNIDLPYVHDTGTANHLAGLYSPPLANINEGRTVLLKIANNNTGPVDFTPNSFPTYPVVHGDGSPIKSGENVIDQVVLLTFDGARWQMVDWCCGWGPTPDEPGIQPAGSGKSLQFTYGYWPTDWAWTYYPSPTSNAMSWLQRTPSMNGNRSVWSFSAFIKRPNATTIKDITQSWSTGIGTECWFSAGSASMGGDYTGFLYTGSPTGNVFTVFWGNSMYSIGGAIGGGAGGGMNGYWQSQVMMDTKWHHFLMNADGSKLSIYIDGILLTQGDYTGLGAVDGQNRLHTIGAAADPSGMAYGATVRMAEVRLIDGLCLPWTAFANNIGGIVVPKVYTGVYGPDGFYLNWNDSSAVTSTTLGKDYSGNANNFTPVNFTLAQVLTDFPG